VVLLFTKYSISGTHQVLFCAIITDPATSNTVKIEDISARWAELPHGTN